MTIASNARRRPALHALALRALALCALALIASGCSDRVIGSGEFTCDGDSDCAWGWRCLVIEGGARACVDTSSPTGGDGSLPPGSDGEGGPAPDGGPGPAADAGPTPSCGNGVVDQTGETCDLGQLNSLLPDAPCRPDCTPPRCGDNVIDSGEQCDGQAGCSAGCEAASRSRLVAQPPAMHFGALGLGCGPTRVARAVKVLNPNKFADITVEEIELLGDCQGFVPEAFDSKLPAGANGKVRVALEPVKQGLLAGCRLVITASDGELIVPLTAEVGAKDQQTDRFVQRPSRKVDILFAVDPSGSMADERSRLMQTAPAFAAAAAQAKLDFHLGSISIVEPSGGETDQVVFGQLHGDPRYITSQSTDLIGEFKTRIDMYSGGGIERALDALHAALLSDLAVTVDPDGCNKCSVPHICVAGACRGRNFGFRRPDASLEVLVLTDEADGSTIGGGDLLDALKALVNPLLGQSVRIHGLLPSKSSSCAFVEQTPVWDGLIPLAGGLREDVCASDFLPAINAITDRLFGMRRQFFLNRQPVPASIKATVDGQPAAPAPTYDAASNSLVLGSAPAQGALVEIAYQTVCPKQ